VLTGTAPYRLLLSAPEEALPGAYSLIVQRADRITGCSALPLGAIGDTTGVIASLSADRFATCYTIPAGQHASSEILSFAPVSGGGTAVLSVRDDTGRTICGGYGAATSQLLDCDFAAGRAYTAVLTGSPSDAQFRVSRRDASPAGAKCRTPASTVLGGPATAGTLTAPDEVHCFRITTTASTVFWLGPRSTTDSAARYRITDAAGKSLCAGYVYACRVSGSTGYQVFLRSTKPGTAVAYRFDAWQLGTSGKAAPQCQQAYGAPGFGPLTGTLNEQRTAVCVAVPIGRYSDFTVALTNTAGGADVPTPYYLRLGGTTDWAGPCSYATGGRGCSTYLPSGQTSDTALFILAPRTVGENLPFRAVTACSSPGGCAIPYVLGAVTPNSALNSGPVNLSLQGNGLSATDTVTLTRSGSASVKGVVRSFVNGVLTVTADVTGAAAGAWNVTIRSAADGRTATIANAVTVRATALKSTKAPAVSGTVRVGSTVKVANGVWSPAATSYSYQWYANGVAIKGAVGSSYAINATMRGKRLSVTVTAKRANRVNSPAASAGVTVGWGVAPVAKTKPSISGTVRNGKTVKAKVGTWSLSATSYKYVWKVNGKTVGTGSKLKLKKSWKGKKLTLTVTAKRTGHLDGKATSKTAKVK
jgi:hypothetical protein